MKKLPLPNPFALPVDILKRSIVLIILGFNFSIIPLTYAQKLTSIQDLSTEQQTAAYKVLKDAEGER